jgi:hypothetical protein
MIVMRSNGAKDVAVFELLLEVWCDVLSYHRVVVEPVQLWT